MKNYIETRISPTVIRRRPVKIGMIIRRRPKPAKQE